MCGIAGIFHKDIKKPVSGDLLTAMAAIQHHRGPDGYGWMTPEGTGTGFAHARLKIIDLSEKGRQPFRSEDGNLMITHNGEFYDYQKIRADLTARGARFSTKSDSEILLHLYPRYGLLRSLEFLRGEFAFALFDRSEDRLILVRDRFGIKPLYWVRTRDGIVFGSEIKVLFAHPEVKREWDPEGLYHQLMQTIVPGTTPFSGVRQVSPGHILVAERKNGELQISEKKYWDMNFPQEKDRQNPESEEFYTELIREKLLEAVHLRLEADVPVGCYLSGGIDSCSILGLASAASQNPVKAFTIGFDSDVYDESAIAKQMADAAGAEQDILRLDASEIYDNLVRTHWHTERTIYNTLGTAKLLMSRHVSSSGYRVVLTGEGSDELFGGYPAFRRDMYLHGSGSRSPDQRRELEAGLQQNNEIFRGAMLAENEIHDPDLDQLCGFTPSGLQPWLAASRRVLPVLSKDRSRLLKHYSPGQAIAAALDPDQIKGRHALDISQYVWIKTMLEGQILTWGGDRVDMANSMEARPAFLDHHLAAAAANLPPSLRIKGNREKHILREAMRGLLPDVLYNREKFAFMAPPAHTDPKRFRKMQLVAEEFLNRSAVKEAGLLDPEAVAEVFRAAESSESSAAEKVSLDALINHMTGVQILDRNLVKADIPAMARKQADLLGWKS